MYQSYYNIFNNLWKDKNEIIMMDTDSFIMNIKTEDVFNDMEKIKEHLDLSEYPSNHKLFSNDNKKVIGKFKDEMNSKIIKEIIFLKSKCYSYIIEEKEIKKLKGCSKVVQDKNISYNEYNNVLNSNDIIFKNQYQIHFKKHEIYFEELKKKVLCAYDDKRFLIDNIRTIPLCPSKIKEYIINLINKNE